MSGSIVAIVVVPVVIALALAACLVMVFWAKNHPKTPRSETPDREVTGGIFQGDRRQMMPRRDAVPGEAASESGLADSDGARDEERRT
jgi:hypothetical protein